MSEMIREDKLPHRIHLVGIGGIGLSAIARVLAGRGHAVSGSDLSESPNVQALREQGIPVFVGHAADQIGDAELLVISSAIPPANPEVAAARARGVPVLKRREFMRHLMAGCRGVAVAGTHGKTTTSGMIAFVLQRQGCDPTFVVGGMLNDLGTNARAGSGECFVIEADEYERMFHGLAPEVAVITHIEMDHPDCYADIDAMREAYAIFVQNISQEGLLVACIDSPQVVQLLEETESPAPVVTYGQSVAAEYRVVEVRPNELGGVDFDVQHNGTFWIRCRLGVPGAYNALDATATLLAVEACGVSPEQAAHTLSEFSGAQRRFEVKGEQGGVVVIDDYAHHPTEIAATLEAARQRYGRRRIWAVLQPHTYSRTEALLQDFKSCFDRVDQVIVTDIYAARAKERPTIDAERLVATIDHEAVRHIGSLEAVEAHLLEKLSPGDVLITLGAGDGYLIGERVLRALEERGR